jgi:hypothetical protein
MSLQLIGCMCNLPIKRREMLHTLLVPHSTLRLLDVALKIIIESKSHSNSLQIQ